MSDSDDKMLEHAVGAGVSFLLGGPVGVAIYAAHSAYNVHKHGDLTKRDGGNWLETGFRSGSDGGSLDKFK